MSRALDLLLLFLVIVTGGFVVRELRSRGTETPEPIEFTLMVRGEVELEGLGVIMIPTEPSQAGEESWSRCAQLTPWSADRTATVRVPRSGRYEVAWGLPLDGPPPLPAVDLTREVRQLLRSLGYGGHWPHLAIQRGRTVPYEVDLPGGVASFVRGWGALGRSVRDLESTNAGTPK